MKVVILCGGKGTRLREETEFRPKPMVPIGGRPIVWHIMKIYAHYGFNEFILCLGYKGDMIKEYFRNYLWNTSDVTLNLGHHPSVHFHDHHNEEKWEVTLADTGEDAMTAYRIRKIQRYIAPGEPFLLTYGDGVSDIDIPASIAEHKRSGKICTLTSSRPPGRFGSLSIDENGGITRFEEKPAHESSKINVGFMVCNHELFDYLPDDQNVMLEREPLMRLAADKQLHSYHHEGFWQPMDTYQEMQYLDRLWKENKAPWKIWI
jgi:glucose-1-phosphate cytidylyltransferase